MSIVERAHAKINLSLDITGNRPDGYHLLRMVMQTLELSDTVTIERKDPECGIRTRTGGNVPDDRDNLAYRAAALLKEETGFSEGLCISIEKRIPVSAGLAGGSSDCAAVLRGVNKLLDLGIPEEKLEALGLKLGADVPYCIKGGTALAEGTGEILTPIVPPLSGCPVLLIKPKQGVSTKEAYQAYDREETDDHPDTDAVVSAVKNRDIDGLGRLLNNVLEGPAFRMVPVIKEIKDFLKESGVKGALMSGSGSTVFALDTDKEVLQRIGKEAAERFPDCFTIISETGNGGII